MSDYNWEDEIVRQKLILSFGALHAAARIREMAARGITAGPPEKELPRKAPLWIARTAPFWISGALFLGVMIVALMVLMR